mmetsp:Transcript_5870/g.17533  ORF Transcript_5870/g.17533 Transcript_5870/m.17533 type:complete len:134 (+) Transcript_5870:1878-2279(+)
MTYSIKAPTMVKKTNDHAALLSTSKISATHIATDCIAPTASTQQYTMGFHLSSFLVGSMFSGGVGLLIHEKLSHRSRLSNKWPLREWMELEFRKQWKTLRSSTTTTKPSNPPTTTLSQEWNKGIEKVQDIFRS